ncbi:hypothetical protein CCDG5_1441 [[Clostridium] cellulosi]|uniref:Uncharacterized protein n=1 Tax=[Clostridium] cellulosi TaxID=29343 RepID=A0A078KLF2_9FIRM|nr:hypothetical protein CCDG5_1441 [[Clostridium] cellulosi]
MGDLYLPLKIKKSVKCELLIAFGLLVACKGKLL